METKRKQALSLDVRTALELMLASSILDSSAVIAARQAWNAEHPETQGLDLQPYRNKRRAARYLLERLDKNEALDTDTALRELALVLSDS